MIIRMCVVCRSRLLQNEMLRLQCKNQEIIRFSGEGRSFYICNECISNPKKINGLIKRYRQNPEYINDLIESLQNR